MMLRFAVSREPFLAAGEEIVEIALRHLAGKIRFTPDGNHPANRFALADSDAFFLAIQSRTTCQG